MDSMTLAVIAMIAMAFTIYYWMLRLPELDGSFRLEEIEPDGVTALRQALTNKTGHYVSEMRREKGRWMAHTTLGWMAAEDLLRLKGFEQSGVKS